MNDATQTVFVGGPYDGFIADSQKLRSICAPHDPWPPHAITLNVISGPTMTFYKYMRMGCTNTYRHQPEKRGN